VSTNLGVAAGGVVVEWLPDRSTPVRLNLTLSVPERHNAQTREMWSALRAVRRTVPGSVRVVVLRGAGPSFSSGIDTALLHAMASEAVTDEVIAGVQEAFDWSGDNAYVSVAAVHGYALGAGLQLALGADLRIVTPDAVLGLPETSYGIVPDLGGTWPLVRAVGYARALDLVVTGRRVTGQEAHQLGLAQRLAPEGLDAAVEALVGQLLAADREVVGEVKALLRGAETRTHDQQRAAEREAQLRILDGLRERAPDDDMPQGPQNG
jgi:enoyl-CoA hydratase/carnithine racemase